MDLDSDGTVELEDFSAFFSKRKVDRWGPVGTGGEVIKLQAETMISTTGRHGKPMINYDKTKSFSDLDPFHSISLLFSWQIRSVTAKTPTFSPSLPPILPRLLGMRCVRYLSQRSLGKISVSRPAADGHLAEG